MLRAAMAPLLFTVPGVDWEIAGYGFFMGLALVLGWIVARSLSRADRLPTDVCGTAYVSSLIAGFFTARATWLAQHPQDDAGWRALLNLSADGLAPFAGVVAALVVSAVLVARRRVPVTAWLDVLAPAFALGAVLERIGALLAGTGYGRFAPDWPLSITFPAGSPAFVDHRQHLAGLMPPGATASLPVHPTQLYAAILAAIGLALAVALRRRRKFGGQVFLGYAIYAVLTRVYVEEWFRADAVQPVLGPFNPAQVGALLLVAALLVILRTRANRAGRIEGGLRYWEGGRWSPPDLAGDATAPAAIRTHRSSNRPNKRPNKRAAKRPNKRAGKRRG